MNVLEAPPQPQWMFLKRSFSRRISLSNSDRDCQLEPPVEAEGRVDRLTGTEAAEEGV